MTRTHEGEAPGIASEELVAALAALDPAGRALLDLSLRRGMRLDEIADLLKQDVESVALSRDRALEQVATRVGLESGAVRDELRARLAELPSEAWTDGARGSGRSQPPSPAGTRHGRVVLGTVVALAAIAALVIALASGGGDESKKQRPAAARPRPHVPAAPKGPAALHSPIAGSAVISQGRLVLSLKGLPAQPDATYVAWLMNTRQDAEALASSPKANPIIGAVLPANAKHYRFIDVSLQPKSDKSHHTGVSVARIPLAQIPRR